jgi:hypothetical protein
LPGGLADHSRGPGGVQLVIEVEPDTDGDPGEDRESNEKSLFGGRDCEGPLKRGREQLKTDPISRLERQDDQNDVGKRKENPHFAMVTAKH